MSMGAVPPREERDVGLEVYVTSTEPLGGKLKRLPDDFIVDEILELPEEKENGKFVTARIESYNWETNRLIRALSRKLGISRNSISFAGTKDKRAITTQYFSIVTTLERIDDLYLKDIRILDRYYSNRKLEIGDLKGNHFRIKIKGIDLERTAIKRIVKTNMDEINNISGFANFFGVQRFGIIRSITHKVGEMIVKNDIEKAVFTYIGNPCKKESSDAISARDRIEKERDFKAALSYYPVNYSFERMMIDHLSKRDSDWEGAIEVLPLNLKMMFIHAYQSYLFNRILSSRIKKGLSLNEPSLGDIIIPLNNQGIPDHHRPVRVNNNNIKDMNDIVKGKKGFITGLIMGMEPIFAEGEMGEIERKIIKEEKLKPDDFLILDIKGINSRGIRRNILAPVYDLKWRLVKDPDITFEGEAVEMEFKLFRGTYATVLLRELMKGDIMSY
ncbi:MAG: tRNA pseudouridine(13) synthase TruD [Thermoplasmata archaeon]|nr:tRNA pseudouridine(13) synthase TruD [Thermoplasmata archaeon]